MINLGNAGRGYGPPPDGAIDEEDRFGFAGLYAGNVSGAPTAINVPNISARFDSGTHEFDLSLFFIGATGYAIDPAVEAGWTFDVNTGLLTIDTDVEDTFGPYTVTADNAIGSVEGNAFTVKVSVSSIRPYRGWRKGLANYL